MSVFAWRDHLAVHPAADLFPLMSERELRDLGEDIKKNGLQSSIIFYRGELLDGRNRLAAMALVGIKFEIERKNRGNPFNFDQVKIRAPKFPHVEHPAVPYLPVRELVSCLDSLDDPEDPYAYALSANIHRRHLTAEQKRDLIGKLLKAQPESSDRAIAKTVTADHKTVAAVRSEMEGRGDIPHVEKRTDSAGRKQPAKKPEPDDSALRERAERLGCQLKRRGSYYRLIKPDGSGENIGDLHGASEYLDIMERVEREWTPAKQAPAEQAPLQPTDDPDASAERRKAVYAASDGSGCNYDPTDPLPGDTYSSIWERQVDVACQTVEFVVTNLNLNLANNLEPKGYRTKKKQLEAIRLAVKIWSQLEAHCSRLVDADAAEAA
jgi:hypothetical protein